MNGRTKFVAACMTLMFLVSWTMSLGRLFGNHFWNPQYATHKIVAGDDVGNDNDGDTTTTTATNATASSSSSSPIESIGLSYYSHRRYIYFFPHVVGAVLWWNLYFIQLIPSVRRDFKWLHRNLGRLLMIVAIAQVWSGLGLARTSHSPVIKLVSLFLSLAVTYCLLLAFYYAFHRDITKHKFWVLRLVGYMHTIVLQRFWLLILILLRQSGWDSVLRRQQQQVGESTTATNDPDADVVISYDMFDQSFIMAILTAWLVTEWYLSAELLGMAEAPRPAEVEEGRRRREPSSSRSSPSSSTDGMKLRPEQLRLV